LVFFEEAGTEVLCVLLWQELASLMVAISALGVVFQQLEAHIETRSHFFWVFLAVVAQTV
jgi:hypothetical protein